MMGRNITCTVMNGEQSIVEKTISSLTRRGRTIECLVSVTPLHSSEGNTTGIVVLMDEPQHSS
jgi:hypothetical protein